jgi:hypothetical protein
LSKSAPDAAILRPGIAEAALVVAAVAGVAFGFAIGNAYALPLIQAALAYPFFRADVRALRGRRALARMLVWAAALSFALVLAALLVPERAASIVLRGAAYRDEMFAWIRTGVGAETDPSRFLKEHALHLAAFSVLALVSGGFLSLALGALLLNYMNFYVAELVLRLDPLFPAILVAWPLYAMVRVAGFITISIALAHLSFALLARRAPDRAFFFRYFYAGLVLVAFDAALKIVLAPIGRDVLFSAFAPN